MKLAQTNEHLKDSCYNPFHFFNAKVSQYARLARLQKLHEAIAAGKLEKVKQLISRYEDGEELTKALNTPDKYGATPIELSFIKECYECTAFLLEKGANPNQYYCNGVWKEHLALRPVTLSGDADMARLLCLYGASIEGIKIDPNAGPAAQERSNEIINLIEQELQPLGKARRKAMDEAIAAEQAGDLIQAATNYREVIKAWEKAYQDESGQYYSQIKAFYLEQVQHYKNKVKELEQTQMLSNSESSYNTGSGKEHNPLWQRFKTKKNLNDETELYSLIPRQRK